MLTCSAASASETIRCASLLKMTSSYAWSSNGDNGDVPRCCWQISHHDVEEQWSLVDEVLQAGRGVIHPCYWRGVCTGAAIKNGFVHSEHCVGLGFSSESTSSLEGPNRTTWRISMFARIGNHVRRPSGGKDNLLRWRAKTRSYLYRPSLLLSELKCEHKLLKSNNIHRCENRSCC